MASSILVVDDSGIMRSMIRRTIAMAGLEVGQILEAGNGIEAFAQLAEHEISVVLLDINMPVMNGVQFLRRMHDDPRLKDIPVVVASTEGSETRIAELRAMGARGYVRKPFHPEQLRDALAPFISIGSASAAPGGIDADF